MGDRGAAIKGHEWRVSCELGLVRESLVPRLRLRYRGSGSVRCDGVCGNEIHSHTAVTASEKPLTHTTHKVLLRNTSLRSTGLILRFSTAIRFPYRVLPKELSLATERGLTYIYGFNFPHHAIQRATQFCTWCGIKSRHYPLASRAARWGCEATPAVPLRSSNWLTNRRPPLQRHITTLLSRGDLSC